MAKILKKGPFDSVFVVGFLCPTLLLVFQKYTKDVFVNTVLEAAVSLINGSVVFAVRFGKTSRLSFWEKNPSQALNSKFKRKPFLEKSRV